LLLGVVDINLPCLNLLLGSLHANIFLLLSRYSDK